MPSRIQLQYRFIVTIMTVVAIIAGIGQDDAHAAQGRLGFMAGGGLGSLTSDDDSSNGFSYRLGASALIGGQPNGPGTFGVFIGPKFEWMSGFHDISGLDTTAKLFNFGGQLRIETLVDVELNAGYSFGDLDVDNVGESLELSVNGGYIGLNVLVPFSHAWAVGPTVHAAFMDAEDLVDGDFTYLHFGLALQGTASFQLGNGVRADASVMPSAGKECGADPATWADAEHRFLSDEITYEELEHIKAMKNREACEAEAARCLSASEVAEEVERLNVQFSYGRFEEIDLRNQKDEVRARLCQTSPSARTEAVQEAASAKTQATTVAKSTEAVPSESSESVESRLAKLKNLKDQGLITDAEYQTKRKAILDSL